MAGLLAGFLGRAQGYQQLLDQASAQLGQKSYCEATATFTRALADSAQAGPFDLFAGATAAANCPGQQAVALRWLRRLPRFPDLPLTNQDVDNMAQDDALASLHNRPEWVALLGQLRAVAVRREAAARQAAADWRAASLARAVPAPTTKGPYAAAQPGLALYYAPADTVRVPYLVYVPRSYRPGQPAPLLVYLHGGVASTPQFRDHDPRVAEEPIFAAAERQHALVLYPYGRQSFGWLEQRAALDHVGRVVAQVRARYHVAAGRVYLGGMSNGGTAAFWFACQQPAGFAGFYALSATPTSALGPLNFRRLGRGAPLYSINAEDDDVYSFKAVRASYEQHRAEARHWHFASRPNGGHGFLYGPDGPAALGALLTQLMGPPLP